VLYQQLKGKHMSALASLKLSAARKPRSLPDAFKRRSKLLMKLGEQRELALAQSEGRTYTPKRLRTLKDATTGERVVREVPVRMKAWFWTGEKNETLLSIFYGSKTLELGKGKTAIEVATSKDLVIALDAVITAVKNGELDAQIEAASTKLRDGFKK
jgi:hypothetical protein